MKTNSTPTDRNTMMSPFGESAEPEEWSQIRLTLRTLLEKHASMEQVRQWDIDNEWPSELFQLLADLGYFAMPFDEEFGGSGAGPSEMVVAAEVGGRRGEATA